MALAGISHAKEFHLTHYHETVWVGDIKNLREPWEEEARPRWRLFHGGWFHAEHVRPGRWHAPSPKKCRGANAIGRRFVGEFEMTLKEFNARVQRPAPPHQT
jgi:hypothetical protein